jgi:hypothetical protein
MVPAFTTAHSLLVVVSKGYPQQQRYVVHQMEVNQMILTYIYHSWSGFMTEVRKTDVSLTETMTNLRVGWVPEKRRQKCRGTWIGHYTIKFSVFIFLYDLCDRATFHSYM